MDRPSFLVEKMLKEKKKKFSRRKTSRLVSNRKKKQKNVGTPIESTRNTAFRKQNRIELCFKLHVKILYNIRAVRVQVRLQYVTSRVYGDLCPGARIVLPRVVYFYSTFKITFFHIV